MVGKAAVVWAVSIAVLAWGVRRPAWGVDEGASVMVVRRSFAQVLETLRFDPALEPYYVLLKAWSLPSTSEFWLRLSSVLAMAGAVTAVWYLVRRLAGDRAGVFAALLMLVMPTASRYGQEARPYALTVLLVVLVVICWDDDRLLGSRRWAARVAVLVAMAGAAHAYVLLIVPVLVVVSGLAPRADRRREVIATAAAGAVGALLLTPYLAVVALRANGQPGAAPVTVANVWNAFLRLPVQGVPQTQGLRIAVAVLGLAAVGIALGWSRGGRARRTALLGAVWLVLPPLSLCLFQVVTGSPGLVARYWLFCLPAIALTAALTLDWLSARSRGLVAACVVGLCVLVLPSQVALRSDDNAHGGQGYRDLPRILALPGLRDVPLLARAWSYRAIVSNAPSLANRMPMVIDPAPSGRINPLIAGASSEAFARLARDHDVVLILQHKPGRARSHKPTVESFPSFQNELRVFPNAAVLCTDFGQPLGVFTKPTAALTDEQARQLADQIMSVAPGHVTCAPGR